MTSAAFRPRDLTAATQAHPALAKTASFVAPSRYRRTDTTYSSSSSRESVEVSPAFSFVQQSPSTVSPATTITSPMMSLSAESPIMLPDPAISMSKRVVSSAARVSQAPAFTSLPASALPLPPGQPARRESSSFLFKQLSLASPNFAPFNGSNYAAAAAASGNVRARSTTLSYPTSYGEESELRDTSSNSTTSHKTPGLSDRDAADGPSDASAAALLLNFSTSPEVLRPVGWSSTSSAAHRAASVASSPHTRPVVGLPHNRSRSTFSSPQYRPIPASSLYSSKLGTPATSASKAEMAAIEEPEPLDLASPPHLALDSSSPDVEVDQLSERTIDELPEEVIKAELETVEMDTAA